MDRLQNMAYQRVHDGYEAKWHIFPIPKQDPSQLKRESQLARLLTSLKSGSENFVAQTILYVFIIVPIQVLSCGIPSWQISSTSASFASVSIFNFTSSGTAAPSGTCHLSPVAILGKWWPHWDSFRGYSQLQPLFGEGINHTVRCSDSSRRSTQQPRSTTTSVLGDCITFSHCVQLPATSDPFLPQALRTNSSKSQPKKRLEHQWGNSPKKSWKYMFG